MSIWMSVLLFNTRTACNKWKTFSLTFQITSSQQRISGTTRQTEVFSVFKKMTTVKCSPERDLCFRSRCYSLGESEEKNICKTWQNIPDYPVESNGGKAPGIRFMRTKNCVSNCRNAFLTWSPSFRPNFCAFVWGRIWKQSKHSKMSICTVFYREVDFCSRQESYFQLFPYKPWKCKCRTSVPVLLLCWSQAEETMCTKLITGKWPILLPTDCPADLETRDNQQKTRFERSMRTGGFIRGIDQHIWHKLTASVALVLLRWMARGRNFRTSLS